MEKRFIVDNTLGKLAKCLRAIGFDTIVFRSQDLHRLIQISQEENRIILTRNRRLEPKLFLGNIVIVKEDKPDLQIGTVLRSLKLHVDSEKLLSRCLMCNEELILIPRGEAEGTVPEFVFHAHTLFHRCPSCQRIYWEGTHPKNMKKKIEQILGDKIS
ncbi:MAG: hypothetical protein GTN81_06645 [Proteobacteria bacterium]|nr:hypothetical protein [Pseudomonadota bacterium]